MVNWSSLYHNFDPDFVFLYKSYRHTHAYGCGEWFSDKLIAFSWITMIFSAMYVTIDWYRMYDSLQNGEENWDKGLIITNDVIYYSSTVSLYIALFLFTVKIIILVKICF